MKRFGTVAATAALVLLIGLKFLMPQVGAELREKFRLAMERELDYAEAFFQLSDGPQAQEDAPSAATPEPTAQQPRYLYVSVTAPPTPEPTPSPSPTAEPTPTPLPAAVTAFLESQEAFSDYALPEKADYSYVELPFEYTVPVSGYNSSGYGYRLHPILNTVRFHYGTDFAAGSGERVLAFTQGTVSFSGYDESYGWHIKIDHGDGWETLYAHCSKLYVVQGQTVNAGDCIALVGSTGLATGPHLHFELTRDGKYLNPEYYINS